MFKVAVLMSTYYGEKYLREQIDSILAQEEVDVTLYIRDDGSYDSTIDIIESYQKEHQNVVLTKGQNIGVGNSFMQLVYDVPNDFDYYAFADQDDVWMQEKLKRASIVISEESSPILYCSNQTLVDKDLNRLGIRFNQKPDTSYLQILCQNKITGCTMVWNNSLNEYLKNKRRQPAPALLRNRIHDVWVAMVASVVGVIIFDMNSYIYYRQHENNVVGVKQKTIVSAVSEKVRKIFNPDKRNGRSKLAKEVCRKYKEFITNQTVLIDSASYKKRKLLFDVKEIIKYSGETSLSLSIKILLGLY